MRNIAISLFINTTLFLGGLHQELYVICDKLNTEWINKEEVPEVLQEIVPVGLVQKTFCSTFMRLNCLSSTSL